MDNKFEHGITLKSRKRNQAQILRAVFENESISRAEVSKMLKMSKPAVNEHIDYLLKEGIISEIGEGESNKNGGRRPILLAPNDSYKYIIAVDLNYTKPLLALGTISGYPIEKNFIDDIKNNSWDNLNEILKNAINELLYKNRIALEKIGIIVVSLPGIINSDKEVVVYNPQHEKIHKLNIFSYLKKNFDVPVVVKNDVNTAALAEATFFKSEGLESFMYLSCGNGLGAGIILNGKLYEGAFNAAGEIGFFLDENSKPLEEVITIGPLIQSVKNDPLFKSDCLLKNTKDITFDSIVMGYTKEDRVILEILKKIGRKLGVVINNSAALLDIQAVILGGDYLAFKDTLINEIESVLEKSTLLSKPKIIASSLDYAGGIIGGFKVATDYLIKNEFIKE